MAPPTPPERPIEPCEACGQMAPLDGLAAGDPCASHICVSCQQDDWRVDPWQYPTRHRTPRRSRMRQPQTAPRYDAQALARIRAAALETAETQNARWPQYAGHWRTPEWYLVRVTRRVATKLGVAFEQGDIALARWDQPDPRDEALFGPRRPFLTAYSARNRIDTSIAEADTEPLEPIPPRP